MGGVAYSNTRVIRVYQPTALVLEGFVFTCFEASGRFSAFRSEFDDRHRRL
jgi:hypothetical protein